MFVDQQVSAPSSGSRRRQALMKQGEASEQQSLSQADVVALASDRSIDGRVNLARKFGSQFDSLATNGGTKDLGAAVLELLVKDVETEVRKSLSEAISTSHQLPQAIASHMARDSIEVAAPILENSPVISDEELVEIVRTNAMQYALAVAARHGLSESVSDALVDTGDKSVVLTLVSNDRANISNSALSRINEDYEGDNQIRSRLVQRPALPYELVDEMVSIIGERLQWQLVHTKRIDPAEVQALMDGVRQRASIGLTAREHGRRDLRAHMSERFRSGELTQEEILSYLKDGDVASFEAAMAALAEVEESLVRKLAYNPDRRYLAALCIRAGIHTPNYIVIRIALDLADEAVSGSNSRRSYSEQSMRFVQDQYERFRKDLSTVNGLLGEEATAITA